VDWSVDPDSKITLGMHICSPRTVYFVIVRWATVPPTTRPQPTLTPLTHTASAVACVVCPPLHHLVSTVEKLLFNWKNVRVSVYFKESRAVYEALLVHQVTPLPI